MALLVKNATLLSGRKLDVLVEGNSIARIAPSIRQAGAERLDASGKLLIPGLVNTHCHSPMSLLRGFAEDMPLQGWLSSLWELEAKLSPKQIRAGALLSCLEMIRGGTTCFADNYFFMDGVAAAVQESGMRAVLGYGMIDAGKGGGADEKKRKSELATAEKFIREWHGKAGGRIGGSVVPHAIYTASRELLLCSAGLSEKYRVPLQLHLSETRKEVFDCLQQNGKRPAHYLDSLGILSSRMVAAHCVWLTKEEVRLLASRGVSASLNIASNLKLAGGGVPPLPEMLGLGMNVSLGTDGPASNNSLSMFESMKLASLVVKNSRWDASAAGAQDMFSAATLGGARALGLNTGEIREGKLADFALLDLRAPNLVPAHSLVSNAVYSAHAGNVTDTIIDGRLAMENRKVLTLDEEKVVEQAQREAERIKDGS